MFNSFCRRLVVSNFWGSWTWVRTSWTARCLGSWSRWRCWRCSTWTWTTWPRCARPSRAGSTWESSPSPTTLSQVRAVVDYFFQGRNGGCGWKWLYNMNVCMYACRASPGGRQLGEAHGAEREEQQVEQHRLAAAELAAAGETVSRSGSYCHAIHAISVYLPARRPDLGSNLISSVPYEIGKCSHLSVLDFSR